MPASVLAGKSDWLFWKEDDYVNFENGHSGVSRGGRRPGHVGNRIRRHPDAGTCGPADDCADLRHRANRVRNIYGDGERQVHDLHSRVRWERDGHHRVLETPTAPPHPSAT